ncbi:5S rRNA maturation endonuclease (ribonuclease M5) [Halarchaeum rubridurum]|uniref:DNA primase DnaG n=1 Tax=Halarchaeum rubridurum TaxID=489911 RepID=A0A830FNP3_9EURY|nr:DNA primase DnaG [Halarchaeum rubridurum]MBP1953876.1 5S rRNA maturation endonuclease (ribonuclease M5) [Halarchaeum rubridurum]GGM55550.1 DNA primase [Halarchaeum rubridurum]
MEDTAKYRVHADLVADGIVERSDVVGAVFGQTEGLLGDELDIHALQDASKLGRLDVDVETEGGQSFGHITLASNLDRVETSVLGAALEAIERVGPCRATVEVSRIEDCRAAKRREITERAKELLATSFDEGAIDSDDILTEVREAVRVGDVTEFEGFPAGPNVESSDAVVVVEGRADVVTLLKYGVKNAIAVEGTSVPDAVADLTRERRTTAFLDGDRGGDLILEELRQVGDVDYVASPPDSESVEDLSRAAVHAALRGKRPAGASDATDTSDTTATTDTDASASSTTAADASTEATDAETLGVAATDGSAVPSPTPTDEPESGPSPSASDDADAESVPDADDQSTDATGDTPAESTPEPGPTSTADAAASVRGSGRCRCYAAGFERVADTEAADAFETLRETEPAPMLAVRDGPITQRLLDVAAQRGVEALVGTERADVVKEPVSVALHTFDDLT